MKNGRKNKKNILVCYFFKSDIDNFKNNFEISKKSFDNFLIFDLNKKNLAEDITFNKVNIEENNFYAEICSYFSKNKKIINDYVLFLEENEYVSINDISELMEKLDDSEYIIEIKSDKTEVFDFEIQPFNTKEVRLFPIKKIVEKNRIDFFYQKDLESISPEIISIKKNEIDPDFEILKTNSFDSESYTGREYFLLGNAWFYKEAMKAEEFYLKSINEEDNIYKILSENMLMKLFLRKTDYDKSIKMFDQNDTDPFNYLYSGFSYFAIGNELKAFSLLKKCLRQKNNLPFIYNSSDINHKLFSRMANILFNRKHLNYSEKLFLIADEMLPEKKSPEIFLYLARIKFIKAEYDKSFEYLVKIFQMEYIPEKTLKEAKQTFLNLLLFIDFNTDFLKIISNNIFDNSEEILRIADTYYMDDNFEPALQIYLFIIEKFGLLPQILFKLGYICAKLRILDQSAYYFEKFLEIESNNLDAINNLAFIYLNLEKTELSEKYYLKLLQLNNYSFDANLHLAIIYISRNDKEKAKIYLERAKTINPVSSEFIKLNQIFRNELQI